MCKTLIYAIQIIVSPVDNFYIDLHIDVLSNHGI
jgi:hypothetical protein